MECQVGTALAEPSGPQVNYIAMANRPIYSSSTFTYIHLPSFFAVVFFFHSYMLVYQRVTPIRRGCDTKDSTNNYYGNIVLLVIMAHTCSILYLTYVYLCIMITYVYIYIYIYT